MNRSIHLHPELVSRIRDTHPPDVKTLKKVLSDLMQADVVESFEYLPDADPSDHGYKYEGEPGVLVVNHNQGSDDHYYEAMGNTWDLASIGEICGDAGVWVDY